MRKSLQTTPQDQQNLQVMRHSQYNSKSQQNIQNKSNFHQIQPIEMETFTIGQPISQDGILLMTPLLKLNSPRNKNLNYCPTPMSHSRINNNIQFGSYQNIPINQTLSSLKLEQFPDSDLPQTLFCFKCNKLVITQVDEEYGCGTYSVALGLCIVFFPCAFIPFMQKQCKDYLHFCGECKAYLGKKVFLCRLC